MRILLLLALLLSGAAALVEELAWTRVASTWFGVSAHAIGTIVSAFLVGLGLGAWGASRLAARWPGSPLRRAALAEAVVAISAVLVQAVFSHAGPLMRTLAVQFPDNGPAAISLRFGLMLVLLLPPTLAMGASLPFFLGGLRGRWLGVGYGANVAGAALGCWLAAFVLLPGVGVQASVWLAATGHLGAAALALAAGPVAAAEAPEEPEADISSFRLHALVGLAGLAILADEVVWSRVYRQAFLLLNPFHAFATVLTAILAGMGLGSIFLPRRGALRAFSALQAGIVVFAVLGLAQVRLAIAGWFGDSPLPRTIVAWVTLFTPAMMAGACFPLLARLRPRGGGEATARIGSLYAVSTLGGVAGSLLGGFVLIPELGVRVTLLAIAGLHAACAALATRSVVLLLTLAGVVGGAVALTRSIPEFPVPGPVLALVDGIETTSVATEGFKEGERMLFSNGLAISTAISRRRVLAPMVMAKRTDRVLLIGYGTGLSASDLLKQFQETHLDCAEIDANQPRLSHWFGTEKVLENPRMSLHLVDGRQFLLSGAGPYDVVIVDSFGAEVNQEFYNVDFFRVALGALAEDGVFYIKLPMERLGSLQDAHVMVDSFAAAFPAAWLVPAGGAQRGLLGARQEFEYTEQDWAAKPAVTRIMLPWEQLRTERVRLTAPGPDARLDSDDRPYFFTPPKGGETPAAVAWINGLVAEARRRR